MLAVMDDDGFVAGSQLVLELPRVCGGHSGRGVRVAAEVEPALRVQVAAGVLVPVPHVRGLPMADREDHAGAGVLAVHQYRLSGSGLGQERGSRRVGHRAGGRDQVREAAGGIVAGQGDQDVDGKQDLGTQVLRTVGDQAIACRCGLEERPGVAGQRQLGLIDDQPVRQAGRAARRLQLA